jgi:hypothetical protein
MLGMYVPCQNFKVQTAAGDANSNSTIASLGDDAVLREAQAFDFRGINAAGCRRELTLMLVQEEYELRLARMAYIEQGVTRGQPD